MNETAKPVLLVWQEIPDETKLYLFTDLTEGAFNSMLKAHGTYINSDNETEWTNWLSMFLYDEENQWYRFEPIMSDGTTEPVEVESLPEGCVIVMSGCML